MKIVLIWASNNPEKYWNKILHNLLDKWYTVYPVNPKEDKIEWLKAYKSLKEIDFDFDILNIVVKPEVTLTILENNFDLVKDKKVWCQPWASNDKVKKFLEEKWFNDYITDSCIMLNKIN